MNRLRTFLEVERFEDYTAMTVLGNPAGKHGGLNSLVTRVRLGWKAILDAGPSKHLAKREVLVKQRFRKGAPGEVIVKGPRPRQSPK